jgi:sec-independent protein translocase protein TatB
MFGIGVPELVLVAIVALLVVGPKRLPVTLRAIGRAIGEFRRASRELRAEVGFDEVVDEVTRPLREGMAGIEADVLRIEDDHGAGTSHEYPEGGPDDYGALPEGAAVYPAAGPALGPEGTVARARLEPDDRQGDREPAPLRPAPEAPPPEPS